MKRGRPRLAARPDAVAVLEAGAVTFATTLVLLQVRHAVTGGEIAGEGWTFREAALQLLALTLLATGLRLPNRRLGDRNVLRWGWRLALRSAEDATEHHGDGPGPA